MTCLKTSYVRLMMGSVSMDVSVEAFFAAWQRFIPGKCRTHELECFRYHLESNLRLLSEEVGGGRYRHGPYRTFTVADPKRRLIAVASIRDRLVHRLVFDELVARFDRRFIFDAWSCRRGKGLRAAIDRVQSFLHSFPQALVWRADIRLFFDSVDHDLLRYCLLRRINDPVNWFLLDQIIDSCPMGIPIGNVTSQIFSNIILNELDRFIVHAVRPLRYLRYGDDFLLFFNNRSDAERHRCAVADFLKNALRLSLHPRNDIIVPARAGLRFCGYEIFATGRRLRKGAVRRMYERMRPGNVGSYSGLVRSEHCGKTMKLFHWHVLGIWKDKIFTAPSAAQC